MQIRNDHQVDKNKLSPTSQKVFDLKETVLAEWERRVRLAFQDAQELRHPVFINTIPAYYDNLVEGLTPGCQRDDGISNAALASEHGGERARLTNYNPEEIVLEYQIFRVTLLDVLEQNDVVLTKIDLQTINASIDESIREAVTAFSLVVSALREQFIAALTHDMRTPLSNASMAAELIGLTTSSEKTKELAERIFDNISRVDKMAQQLLDTMVFQKGQRLRLQISKFDILDVANEVCDALLIHKSRFQIAGASVKGWWDRDTLKRALENLTGNALKYGAPKTPIRLKISEAHERLVLSVHNEGAPIPVEEQESIFQIFRRAHDAKDGAQPGYGIGLPYIRAVAESHGGSVVIESTAEKGTTFLIDIPLDSRPFQTVRTLAVAPLSRELKDT